MPTAAPPPARRADHRPRGFRRMAALAVVLAATSSIGGASVVPERSADAAVKPRSSGGTPVQVWMTTTDRKRLLTRQRDVSMVSGTAAQGLPLEVDSTAVGQTVRGFGASLTESSAVLLDRLPPSTRDAAYVSLFDRDKGIGLSYLRQPVGATDFSLDSWSLADTADGTPDPELRSFSLARDEQHVLPGLRRAQQLNPELRVLLTPWSAPAWMKTSGHLHGGSLAPEHYGDYSAYLLRAVDGYRAAGVVVDALTVANEPLHTTDAYPSMGLSADAARTLVGRHLGPALRARGNDVRVFGYDHNWDDTDYPTTLLADPESGPVLTGTAWHCYGGDVSAQEIVRRSFPDKEVLTTECTGGSWAPDFDANLRWNSHVLLIGSLRTGSSGLTLWNLALDPSGGPTNGGCQGCRGVVTVDPQRGTVTHNVEYYVLGHLAKFVRPGAVRVGSTSYGTGYVESVAFRNRDGRHAAVLHNNGGTSQTVSLRHSGRSTSLTLPAGSLTTVTW